MTTTPDCDHHHCAEYGDYRVFTLVTVAGKSAERVFHVCRHHQYWAQRGGPSSQQEQEQRNERNRPPI